ncbi:MAG: hypothetical protein ACRBDI_09285 [Alphaproteobacteria bacterium]
MSLNIRFFVFSLFSVLLFIAAPSSHAQQSSNTQIEIIPDSQPRLFNRDGYSVQFLDQPYDSISKFTMRIAAYEEVTGCASMSQSKVTVKDTLESKNIEVKESEIKLDNKTPRYTNYDCDIKSNSSYFDIILDRDDLIKRGIKKIKLTSEDYGDFTTADIEVTEQKIDFKTKTADGDYLLTYWFLPENTVILHTPYANSNLDTKDLIKSYARQRGLLPVEERFEGYMLPYDAKHYAMFIDRWNRIIRHIEDPEQHTVIGGINAARTVYGVNGPVEEPVHLDVYAFLPPQQAVLIKK